MPTIEERFHEAMITAWRRGKEEANYSGTRFIQMVSEKGGLATAKQLLHTNKPSEGYVKMWQLGRLDLTMERLILNDEWHSLFTDEERQIAISRLREYGHREPLPPARTPDHQDKT